MPRYVGSLHLLKRYPIHPMISRIPFALCLLVMLSACSFTQKVRTGADAFSVKQYALAARLLEEEYQQTDRVDERAARAFMIGQSFENMRMPEHAAPWYKKAHEHRYGPAAQERYAETLRQSERYEEAIEVYRELMADGSQSQKYRGLITLCTQAIQWKADAPKSLYQVEPVTFNSSGSDYAPAVIAPDIVIFTSDRKSATGNNVYQWTGRSFSDLYMVNTATGQVQLYDHLVNTQVNEGTITFTSDRTEMYFTRCFQDRSHDSHCKLMMCRQRGASWSEPEVLPFVQDGINYGHPVLTGNDNILIFSSNDPAGAGGYDLFYSERLATGWNTPVSLGERINTTGNERFPFMHHDTLYFSSDHHPGLGGYDIFRSHLDANGQWTVPLNLLPPVNSGYDDFAFVIDTFAQASGDVLQRGYFSSSRNRDSADDIFAFRKVKPVPAGPEEIVTQKTMRPEQYHVYLVIRTMQPVFATPGDPNSERTGKAILPHVTVDIGEGLMMRREKSDANGTLILELAWDKTYEFQAKHLGFFTQHRAQSTTGIARTPDNPVVTLNMEIVMEPIFEDTEVILQDIFYDYDEWAIREDAKPALDALAKILHENPPIRIQLSSHTDCRGTDAYNQELSQKRAQSAVDYLIAQRIGEHRLVAVGYGESRPAVDCECTRCTEAQHQQNRRTTFKILPREQK